MNLEDDILIERFLRNELSKGEEASFLQRIDSDTLFKEHVLTEKQLFETLNDQSWSFLEESTDEVKEYETILRNTETQKVKEAISQAQKEYTTSKKPQKKNWFIYSGAAAIALFFIVNIYNLKDSNQELFSSYLQETDLLALVNRGDSDNLSKAQDFFNNKEFKKADSILSQVIDSIQNGNVYLYLALSQIELKEYEKAENTLNKLINSNLLDAQKGYWYKSLLYLKSNEIEKSKKELQIIIDNSYFKKEDAKELIQKIN